MKTCLFGGTFDPVHTGHVTMAAAAREAYGLDRVVFLPAACSPFRQGERRLFSPEQRLSLLHAAVDTLPWAEVSDLDLTLPPPSESHRSAKIWAEMHPKEELYWLLGADAWAELHLWAHPERLAELVTFIVCHRGDREPVPREGMRALFLHTAQHPASATRIRRNLSRGNPPPQGWLPPMVLRLAEQYLAAQS